MLRCALTEFPDTAAGTGANQQSVSPAAHEIGDGGSEEDEASGGGAAAAAEAGPSGEKDTGNVNGNAPSSAAADGNGAQLDGVAGLGGGGSTVVVSGAHGASGGIGDGVSLSGAVSEAIGSADAGRDGASGVGSGASGGAVSGLGMVGIAGVMGGVLPDRASVGAGSSGGGVSMCLSREGGASPGVGGCREKGCRGGREECCGRQGECR